MGFLDSNPGQSETSGENSGIYEDKNAAAPRGARSARGKKLQKLNLRRNSSWIIEFAQEKFRKIK